MFLSVYISKSMYIGLACKQKYSIFYTYKFVSVYLPQKLDIVCDTFYCENDWYTNVFGVKMLN